ncbi:MAG: D-alanyl-D-alanine carboxypeptidase [Candidatus Omnitrophica bacterium]|nr:D-alanyl-D-alanine carboxypeptidase [Candidatus Omnitrophota bacterium]
MFSKKILRIIVWVIIFFCFALIPANAVQKKAKKIPFYRISAQSALLFDESGWRKYYSKRVDSKVLPASTTKIMTALIVLERKRLDDIVVVGPNAERVLPSKIDIKKGEKYRVRDLLYAIILNSANDASVALAESVSGSQEKFVALMNQRARQLGARHTVFVNSHGLPSKAAQYSTAYDMFLIFRQALKREFFREAIKIKYMTIHSQKGRKIALKSHNSSLFKGWKEGVYGKTGYTLSAQACFVGHIIKGGKHLFIAVFGCTSRWDDVKYIIEKYGGIDL